MYSIPLNRENFSKNVHQKVFWNKIFLNYFVLLKSLRNYYNLRNLVIPRKAKGITRAIGLARKSKIWRLFGKSVLFIHLKRLLVAELGKNFLLILIHSKIREIIKWEQDDNYSIVSKTLPYVNGVFSKKKDFFI